MESLQSTCADVILRGLKVDGKDLKTKIKKFCEENKIPRRVEKILNQGSEKYKSREKIDLTKLLESELLEYKYGRFREPVWSELRLFPNSSKAREWESKFRESKFREPVWFELRSNSSKAWEFIEVELDNSIGKYDWQGISSVNLNITSVIIPDKPYKRNPKMNIKHEKKNLKMNIGKSKQYKKNFR